MSKPVTIKDVKVLLTQPAGSRLVIVKIITSEPGLYGLGCATFTQRFNAVVAALKHHLIPFAIGRDVSRIEEFWQMAMVHGYWRNGPVLNNAISGLDQALWDIKGKMANMPVYDLLGGKCREAAAVYTHANGRTPEEVADNVKAFMAQGYRYVRIQMGGYGGKGDTMVKPEGAPDGAYYNPRAYTRNMLRMMEHVRKEMPAACLIIVGDGPQRAALEQRTRHLRLTDNVTFVGQVNDDELSDWYRRASVFVFTPQPDSTRGEMEGFGLVCVEAAAAGCPVVAWKTGGVGEAVRDGETGLLVEYGDVASLAAADPIVHLEAVPQGSPPGYPNLQVYQVYLVAEPGYVVTGFDGAFLGSMWQEWSIAGETVFLDDLVVLEALNPGASLVGLER